MSTRRDSDIQMIEDCAKQYKDKLTMEEFLDILATGDATGDGRLECTEIFKAVEEVYKST